MDSRNQTNRDFAEFRASILHLRAVSQDFFDKVERISSFGTGIWSILSSDLQKEADELRAQLRPVMVGIAAALRGSPLLDESDFRELRRYGKTMEAALRFNEFQVWEMQVHSDEDKVLGVEPERQVEREVYSVAEARSLFVEAHRQVVEMMDYHFVQQKPSHSSSGEHKIFIGHGKSTLWKELKDFLSERLKLTWDEFNGEPVAGLTTQQRLKQMLDNVTFAFLIMTAEDEHSGGTMHARENVVHEVGLFQGRLGFEKAIILLEEGCSEFSNITGLTQIRFPKGQISSKFEEVRRVLEREHIVEGALPTSP